MMQDPNLGVPLAAPLPVEVPVPVAPEMPAALSPYPSADPVQLAELFQSLKAQDQAKLAAEQDQAFAQVLNALSAPAEPVALGEGPYALDDSEE